MADFYLACTVGRGSSNYHGLALENGIWVLKGRGVVSASYHLSERLARRIYSQDNPALSLVDEGFLFGDEKGREQTELKDAYEGLRKTLSVTNGYGLGKILKSATQRDCGFSIVRIRAEREVQVERAIDNYFSTLKQDLVIVLADLEGKIVHLFDSIAR